MKAPAFRTADWPLTAERVWLECRRAPCHVPCPALMLDRDGVVIEDKGYIADPAEVALVAGSASLIAAANACALPVCIVTNQSGIDRGLFGWDAFAAVNARMDALLGAQGAHIDAVAACPFHPEFTPDYGAAHARWRKPGPAMIAALARILNLDPRRSWLVGDAVRDMEAAAAAGLAGGVLVGAGAPPPDRGTAGLALHLAPDLAAAKRILEREGGLSSTPPAP